MGQTANRFTDGSTHGTAGEMAHQIVDAPGRADENARHDAMGEMVRRHRLLAGLSQDELAERAGLSTHSISNLERGSPHAPRLDTLRLLAEALRLSPTDRAALLAAAQAARQRPPIGIASRAAAPAHQPPTQHLPIPRLPIPRLPIPPTPLIGREDLLARVCALAEGKVARLLTLVGVGGVGKTHLALEAARRVTGAFADGVVFVSLAPLQDARLVPSAIVLRLGLKESGTQSLTTLLAETLRDRELLLLLDNFEHVAAAAPFVADLLASCPRLMVLSTSRSPLHLRGEHECIVPPLALADPEQMRDVEALERVPSIALFLARVRAVQPAFPFSAENAAAVAAICAKVDGLPLALELAAPRLKMLSPEGLLAQLEHRLDILTSGPRDLPERQRTLRNTLDWSYSLLGDDVRSLFRRLAVFAGSMTLPAIAAVAGSATSTSAALAQDAADGATNTSTGVPAGAADARCDILDALQTLVDHQFLRREMAETATEGTGGHELRLGMLETVREYAREQLMASGEAPAVEREYLRYYVALVEEIEPQLTGCEQPRWLAWLEQEHDNVRAALRYALAHHDADAAIRLAGALWRFWDRRGHLSEGRAWLDAVLALRADQQDDGAEVCNGACVTTAHVATASVAKALNGGGVLAYRQADYARATALCERSLIVRRQLGDWAGAASTLNNLALIARAQGNFERAASLWQAGLALLPTNDDARDTRLSAIIRDNLATLLCQRGKYERARELFEECLAIRRSLHDAAGVATVLCNLGEVARHAGEYMRASALLEESLAIKRAIGDTRGIAIVLNNLGEVVYDQGDTARAAPLLAESHALLSATGDKRFRASCLRNLARVARAEGDCERAEELLCDSLRICEELGDTTERIASLHALGVLATEMGDLPRAATALRRSLSLTRDTGGTPDTMGCLEGLARVACAQRRFEQAATLCSTAAQLRRALGTPIPPIDRDHYDHVIAQAQSALGQPRFRMAWEAGQRMSLDQAITDELAVLLPAREPSSPPRQASAE